MPNKNGLILLTPSSVNKTGTGSTATINTNGSVTFGSCVTLSLNGVFTSAYDNYMIVVRHNINGGNTVICRLRASGTDSTAITDYNYQYLQAASSTISAARVSNGGYWAANVLTSGAYRAGFVMNIYGPYLSQPTAMRTVTAGPTLGASIFDCAGTHELSSSYDGLTISTDTGGTDDMTGLVAVYGLRN